MNSLRIQELKRLALKVQLQKHEVQDIWLYETAH